MQKLFTHTVPSLLLYFALAFVARAQEPFSSVDSGTEVNLTSVHFPTPEIGYIGGELITLLKTTDGGENWQPVELTGISTPGFGEDPIIDIYFTDSENGYLIVEDFSVIYETADGGLSWSALEGTPGDLCFPSSIQPFGPNELMLSGSACFGGNSVAVTDDGLWPEMGNLLEEDASAIRGANTFGSDFAMLASTNGAIYRTASGGEVWERVDVNAEIELSSVHFVNGNLVYATSEDSMSPLYRSDNGGATWVSDADPLAGSTARLSGVLSGSELVLFGASEDPASGFVSTVFTDGEPIVQTFDHSLKAGFTNGGGVHFLVGDAGTILRFSNTVSSDDLSGNSSFIPYPNPVRERLRFSGLEDVQGSLGFRLVNIVGQVASEGELTSEGILVDHLPSGIYFLEVFQGSASLGVRKVMIH